MAMDTVFSPSFGNRPTCLVGRDSVIDRFMHGLETRPGNRSRTTVLLGQRGSGKTVLLWELADRAEAQGFVVAKPTVVSENMLERVVEKIQENGERYVDQKHPRISGGSIGALGFSAGLQFTHEVEQAKSSSFKLTQLVRELSSQGHGTLILVDELQANSAPVRQLVITYQELVGEGLDVALAMAGLPGAVSATLNDRVLTFLNRAQKVTLDSLEIGDVDAFYDRAFRSMEIQMDPKTRLAAAQSTQGSPYLLQLLGHNIAVRADRNTPVTKELVREAERASRIDFENDVCATSVAALSEMDVKFLAAMTQDDGDSRMADISSRLEVTGDYAQKYRRRLIDAGIIRATGRGRVAFAVPHLRSYLGRKDE